MIGKKESKSFMSSYSNKSLSRTKRADLTRAFKEADTDGDGRLTKEEYVNVYRSQGVNMSDEAAEAIFRDRDKDMDGRISYDEFIGELTATERIWNAMGGSNNNDVDVQAAKMAAVKYKKSLPQNLVKGIVDSFDREEKKLNYAEFCALINELKLKDTKSGDNPKNKKKLTKSKSFSSNHSRRSSEGQSSSGDSRTHYSRHF